MNELKRISAIAVLAMVPILAWSQQLEINALRYRTAEQILPVLRALLGHSVPRQPLHVDQD
jgi:hypothetical protein